jgi:hypothetical protein
MGSRLLPLLLALGALVADGAGADRLAYYVVLLAVVGAAAAAFVAVGDALARRGSWFAGVSNGLALVLVVVGSVVRASAPVGAGVPVLGVSTLVMATLVYVLPVVGWFFEPLIPRGRVARWRIRTEP